MKPDRTNYGQWIIDMLDGNLDEEGVMELMSFLSVNPDLKDEFESFIPDSIVPKEAVFSGKEKLHKGIGDLSMSQIDQLSVAALEKDLTPEQESELTICRELSVGAEKRYNTIQKLKLVPGKESFANKRSLKRAVISPTVKRVAFAAAAMLLILLSLTIFTPNKTAQAPTLVANVETNKSLTATNPKTAEPGIESRELEATPIVNETESQIQQAEPDNPLIGSQILEKEPNEPVAPRNMGNVGIANPVLTAYNPRQVDRPDDSPISVGTQELVTPEYIVFGYGISPVEIDYKETLLMAGLSPDVPDIIGNKVTLPSNMEFGEYSDRTIINKLIASAFRKRVLDQESPSDDPIKGYEVAEAWVLTLNRLWETEMAFIKNTDENGEVESVYFDAGLVRFNSKVKKTGVEL